MTDLPPISQSSIEAFNEALISINEVIGSVRAAALGLRHQLVTDGYPEEVAMAFATAYLSHFMGMILGKVRVE